MTEAANRLLQEALTLAPDDRAKLVAELLASLEEFEDDVHEAWAAEIKRRSERAAEEPGADWRTVLDRVESEVLRR